MKVLNRLSCLFIALILTVSGCGRYQKLLKSSDMEKKYQSALQYYNEGDYFRASGLFEELIPVFRATKKAENIYFHYAYCYYQQKEYEMAAFHFENFVKTFPNGEKAEECLFMDAYCYYLNSPGPTLDQENTHKAINNLQLFINKYPQSPRVAQSNEYIDLLREKLQAKDFGNAKLYYDMGEYKAAIVAFKILLKDYPDSKFKEEALFYSTRAYFLLASNSIESKKEERFKSTLQSYYTFIDAYPTSKYSKQAQDIYSKTTAHLEHEAKKQQ